MLLGGGGAAGAGTADAVAVWVALACWAAVGAWTWWRGAEVTARYLGDGGSRPFPRLTLTWLVLLAGAVAMAVSYREPGAPAATVVAMAGTMSILVDARTHRLPDVLTLVMAGGVLAGLACASASSAGIGGPGAVLLSAGVGAAIWAAPLVLGRLARAGVGGGDLKLAPVLGAFLGLAGWDAALGGLVIAFVAAGARALAAVARGRADLRTRLAMGPWLIGGALAAWTLWTLPVPA
ncbi:MAG: prepilin peptidase [Actinomyces sp.]|jgi:leader peptidase (prepilin peptidase)/N-methyltransferase|nr:prepilin peptidase [Actinomyces sp.]MCI1641110.1 prepilin peptidase [Actinomyces sp.]MCI1662371.1 prepilin peptidase [Actinomyces sp.]MCI1691095.1 prepilin peptidase [Actinomyces sp.]MCI1787127.1 prepilin peptidase [Actinomyces sp.]MCI1829307.1 prepilin peptidase [Actinomyces sp.]